MKRQKKDVWQFTEKKRERLTGVYISEQKESKAVNREEKRKVNRCIYQNKKKVNEQFGRKINRYVNGDRNCFGRRRVMRKEERWRVAAERK